ncbi:RNA cytidine acetyltransferase [Nephila pilipes]|uniref:RNA cytidine acetyltransferase n=1 Tax=Nephila pilipes TaxID=299642 RepID=A0A8X6UDY4_NEPPI|nr:RNA cytidine acetyltransferase [Nephila pilipes]
MVDKPIKKLIKMGIRRNHRSLFVILGPKGSKQVPVFSQLLKQYKVKDNSILWCTKQKSDVFEVNNKTNLVAPKAASDDLQDDTDLAPYYCSYSDVEDISHRSFNLVILQDFDGLSLHSLSLVINTVKGGGIIIFLFHHLKSISDLMNLSLNTEHKVSRFNKRFASLLCSCPNSLILNDSLNILSSGLKFSESEEFDRSIAREKIEEIRLKFEKDAVIHTLLGVCHSVEQTELLLKFLEVLKNRSFHAVLSVSSAVGRGKSAALGLAIAGSLAFNYSNIFISSMSYEYVNTVFKFVLKGLDALDYKEDDDFDLIQSVNPKFRNNLTGINIFRDHPQSVRFILPQDIGERLEQAELVVFDEAAAIPMNVLKNLFGPYIVLMASSTSGPGASSPYMYTSMINVIQPSTSVSSQGEQLQKFYLNEPIHYASGDSIESWLNLALCVEPIISSHLSCGFPVPEQCRLFCVNRDTLFGGSKQAEDFLQSLMSILTSSCRSLSSDHLVNLADSPNYNIFCLLPPMNKFKQTFSGLICAILVHLEQEIPDHIIHCGTNLDEPISNCFNEWKVKNMTTARFLPVQGIHVLNIVTHQNYRKMGYGLRALQLLQEFYEGKCISLDENLGPHSTRTETCLENNSVDFPILQQLTEIQPDSIEYLFVSCNLSSESLRFWKKNSFIPAYISEKTNSEGEHMLFMIKPIEETFKQRIEKYWLNFQNHYCCHLGAEFRNFKASLALSVMQFSANWINKDFKELSKTDIDLLIRPHHMKALEKYCQNLLDYHTIIQIIPTLANLYFKDRLKDVALPRVQEAILLSFGIQFKVVDVISKDLGLPKMQIFGLLNRTIKKLANHLTAIIEKSVASTLEKREIVMEPIAQDLDEELEEAAKKIQEKQEQDALKLKDIDISQYAIKGSEEDWEKALFSGRKALVSIRSVKKIANIPDQSKLLNESFKKPKQNKKRKR